MDALVSKIITAVILFIITIILSFIPYFMVLRGSSSIVSARRRNGIIAYLNCLAGGVFMGTLLVHILTEGSEEFEKYKKTAGLETEFPLFNLFVAGGFFLVAFVELFVHAQLHHRQPEVYSGCRGGHSTMTSVHGAVGEVVHPSDEFLAQSSSGVTNYGTIPVSIDKGKAASVSIPSHGNKGVGGYQDTPGVSKSECVTIKSSSRSFPRLESTHHEISGHHAAGVRAFLLLMALSFHTIFDGLAVGLQSNSSQVWAVFGAVTVHKSIIAFCLGLELFQSSPERPWKAMVWLLVFALMSPLGISIGIGLTSGYINIAAKQLASSVLQGVAGGTFLYVTFLEILCMHIGHHSTGNFFYVFFAMVGFCIMAATKLLDQH